MQTTIKDFSDFKRYVEQRKQHLNDVEKELSPLTMKKSEPYLIVLPTTFGCIVFQAHKYHAVQEIWLTHNEINKIHKATQH